MQPKSSDVVLFSDWLPPDIVGGAEKTIDELVSHLSSAQISLSLMTLAGWRNSGWSSHNQLALNRVRALNLRLNQSSSTVIKLIEKIRCFIDLITPIIIALRIRKLRPRIIMLHQLDRVGVFFVPILKRINPGTEIYRVFHDASDLCLKRDQFKRNQACDDICYLCTKKASIYRRFAKYYDEVFFNSGFLQGKFSAQDFNFKSESIGYPIKRQSNPLPMHRLSGSHFRVAFVGRVEKYKGIELLLSAIVEMRNVELHIFGSVDARYFKRLKNKYIGDTLSVIWHGFKENPWPEIRELGAIVVVPSIWQEPFGRVPLEASNNGIPVIASNSGGLIESVKLCPNFSIIFESGNKQNLINAIKTIHEDNQLDSVSSTLEYETLNESVLKKIYSKLNNSSGKY